MDNIKGVNSYIAPTVSKEVSSQAAPREQAPEQKGDSVALGGDVPSMPAAIKDKKKWLFLNVIAADCNLKEFQCKNVDNQELVGSDANTHVVAYIDVGPEPNPLDKTWSNCRTYYVTHDEVPNKINSELISEHGPTDMADPKVLRNFIIDAVGKFPADHVCLVLNDHGGGFTGAMADDTSGGFMSVPQINQAIGEAEKVTGKKIDIIGFDACLMAETEVAYQLKDKANIMLSSEESEGGPGWTYNSMLGGKTMATAVQELQKRMGSGLEKINCSPEEFAKIVVNVNKEHDNDIATFSAIDLKKMDAFKDTMNAFAKAVRKSDDKDAVRNAVNQAENYGGGWAPYKDIRDVQDLADKIIGGTKDPALKKAAEDVKKAVGDVVMANENNPQSHPNSHGISVFIPTDKSAVTAQYDELAFSKDTEWDAMLKELGVGAPASDPNKIPDYWPDGSVRKHK
jgi:hypothetical protein